MGVNTGPGNYAFVLDKGIPIGVTEDGFGKEAIHVIVGNSVSNPIPVSVEAITVGDVYVNLTHLDNVPSPGDVADSVRIGDGVQEWQMDTAGNGLVSDTLAQTILATRASEATLAALEAKFGSLGQKPMTGSAPVVIASDQSAIHDSVVVGSFTAGGQAIDIPTFGRSSLILTITGTWSMFIGFSGSGDGVSFSTLSGYPVIGGDAKTIATVNGNYVIPCAGMKTVRLTSGFFISGTAVINLNASIAPQSLVPRFGVIRKTNPLSIGLPVEFTDQTFQIPGLNQFGLQQIVAQVATLAQWGKSFDVTNNFLAAAAATESPIFLIDNPVGSGVTMRINRLVFSPPVSGDIEYRIYSAPTVTANGTLLSRVACRNTGAASPLVNIYSNPTVSSNGTIFHAIHMHNQVGPYVLDYANGKLVEPGNKILITADQSAIGAPGCVNMNYSEQVT